MLLICTQSRVIYVTRVIHVSSVCHASPHGNGRFLIGCCSLAKARNNMVASQKVIYFKKCKISALCPGIYT